MEPAIKNDKAKIITALLSIYILWGSTYLAIRIALESFPPFFMAGVRFFITGVFLYMVLRLKGAERPTLPQWKGGAIVGAFLLLGGNGGVVYAEQWVASGLAALGTATVPLWAVLFACIWKRRPAAMEWAGIIIGFLGVALLNLEAGMRAHPAGALALIIAAVSWAFGSAWSRELTLPSGLMASSVEMIAGGVLLLTVSLATGENIGGAHTWRSLGALFYLMLFGALIGFSAYTYLLGRVRPALATSYAYVNPAVAVTLGIALAGERITSTGAAAMVIIIFAVALVVIGQRRF